MSKRAILTVAFLFAALALICTQLTIFVVPPMGMLPDGMTIIFPRLSKTSFIDSPDAVCVRTVGSTSLLCRGVTMGTVATQANVIARLPYSDTLYKISTGGDSYQR